VAREALERARDLRALTHKARTEGRYSTTRDAVAIPMSLLVKIHEAASNLEHALSKEDA
jgi:hypothetical protein